MRREKKIVGYESRIRTDGYFGESTISEANELIPQVSNPANDFPLSSLWCNLSGELMFGSNKVTETTPEDCYEIIPSTSNPASSYPNSSLWYHSIYNTLFCGNKPLISPVILYGGGGTGQALELYASKLQRTLSNSNSTALSVTDTIQAKSDNTIVAHELMINPDTNQISLNRAIRNSMSESSGTIYNEKSFYTDVLADSIPFSMNLIEKSTKYRTRLREQAKDGFYWATIVYNALNQYSMTGEDQADFVFRSHDANDSGLCIINTGTAGKNLLKFVNSSQTSPFIIKTVEESQNALYNESLELGPEPVGTETMKGIRIGVISKNATSNVKVSVMSGFDQDSIPEDIVRAPSNESFISGVNSVNRSGFLVWPTSTPLYDNVSIGYNVRQNSVGEPRSLRPGASFCIRSEFGTGGETSLCCGQTANNTGTTPYKRIRMQHASYDIEFMTKCIYKNTTQATSETAAAITTTGGIGITRDLYVKGDKIIAPNMNTPASNTANTLVFHDNSQGYLTTPSSLLTSDYDSLVYYSSTYNRICVHASSQRYKKDITNVNLDYSDFLLYIQLKNYKLVDKTETIHKQLTGVLAEDLYRLNPKSVSYKYFSEEEVKNNNWQEDVIKRNNKVANKPCKLIEQPKEDYLLYALIQQNQRRAEEIQTLQDSIETYREDNLKLVDILKNLSRRVGQLERQNF